VFPKNGNGKVAKIKVIINIILYYFTCSQTMMFLKNDRHVNVLELFLFPNGNGKVAKIKVIINIILYYFTCR
jgi:hypothetical protein